MVSNVPEVNADIHIPAPYMGLARVQNMLGFIVLRTLLPQDNVGEVLAA
jgi:hypothetical protein